MKTLSVFTSYFSFQHVHDEPIGGGQGLNKVSINTFYKICLLQKLYLKYYVNFVGYTSL